MDADNRTPEGLRKTGQVASFADLQKLVEAFEEALNRHGTGIESGSELEAACLSILDVLGKHQNPTVRNLREDTRLVFTEVLGIWTFLTKIVRLQNHPSMPQFIPHLCLLNQGTDRKSVV